MPDMTALGLVEFTTVEALIWERLTGDAGLTSMLSTFNELPAVFYRQAPTDVDDGWSAVEFPRVNFTVDQSEDPERRVMGTAEFEIYSTVELTEPDVIADRIVALLDGMALVPGNEPVVILKWNKTDAMDVVSPADDLVTMVRLTFTAIGFPLQHTYSPDPIAALEAWTLLRVVPALVQSGLALLDTLGAPVVMLIAIPMGELGNNIAVTVVDSDDPATRFLVVKESGVEVEHTPFASIGSQPDNLAGAVAGTQSTRVSAQVLAAGNGILASVLEASLTGGVDPAIEIDPTKWKDQPNAPGIYFRVVSIDSVEIHNWGAWLTARVVCHVVHPSPTLRLFWIRRIVELVASDPRHIFLDNGIPLDILNISAASSRDQLINGQIEISLRFPAARDWYGTEPVGSDVVESIESAGSVDMVVT